MNWFSRAFFRVFCGEETPIESAMREMDSPGFYTDARTRAIQSKKRKKEEKMSLHRESVKPSQPTEPPSGKGIFAKSINPPYKITMPRYISYLDKAILDLEAKASGTRAEPGETDGFNSGAIFLSKPTDNDVVIDRDTLRGIVNERIAYLNETHRLQWVSSQLTHTKTHLAEANDMVKKLEVRNLGLMERIELMDDQIDNQTAEQDISDKMLEGAEANRERFDEFAKMHARMVTILIEGKNYIEPYPQGEDDAD